MKIKNSNFVRHNLSQQSFINNFMPKSNYTEIVNLQNSIGSKVAEDVCAYQEYPLVALSAIDGKMLSIKQDITSIEQYKAIKDRVLGLLIYGEDPFEVKTDSDFIAPISAYMKIGKIANTVIRTEQMLPWFNAAFLMPDKGDILVGIKKGQGVIESGSDYKKDNTILVKNDVITSSKKALLKQSGVKEVIVYKSIRIAVLCVDYDLEDMNNRLEFEYIQDCMKSWGYDFKAIIIKP
ncbi:MoeA protein, partial [Acinetobacter sp. WCHAc060025]